MIIYLKKNGTKIKEPRRNLQLILVLRERRLAEETLWNCFVRIARLLFMIPTSVCLLLHQIDELLSSTLMKIWIWRFICFWREHNW